MNTKSSKENILIQQRIERGGFKNENQLFEHYAKISGKSFSEIKEKCSRPKGWKAFFAKNYHSGIHGLIELQQKMNLGSICKPNLSLATVTTGDDGFRNTPVNGSTSKPLRKCLLLGGSVAFGVGATSDANTIAGRLEYQLNQSSDENIHYSVKNGGMLGFNSFQELIYLMDTKEKYDYVISLSGWNDLDQSLFSNSKVTFLSHSCDNRANQSPTQKMLRNIISQIVTIQVIKRFFKAYINYNIETIEKKTSDNPDIYPMF